MSSIVIQDTIRRDFTLGRDRALDAHFYATKTQIKNAISAARKTGEAYNALTIKTISKPLSPISIHVFVAKAEISLGCHTFRGQNLKKLLSWTRRP
jgi:hypothetical protein